MSQFHSDCSESSTTNGNDTQLLPTQVFHDWLAKKDVGSESARAKGRSYVKDPIVSPVGSSTGSTSDDENADVVSSDGDGVGRSAHIAEEITSPATFLSPNTPYLEGQKQDLGASTVNRGKTSHLETLSNWFGPKAADTVAGLSQIFHQTQAPTSPVQVGLLGDPRANKKRKFSTSPPSSPFSTADNSSKRNLRSTTQLHLSISSQPDLIHKLKPQSNITAAVSLYEEDVERLHAIHESQHLEYPSQRNGAGCTQVINVADSQQENIKSASIANGRFTSQRPISLESALSNTPIPRNSWPGPPGRPPRSQNTSSIPPPPTTSSPYENYTFEKILSPPSITPLAQGLDIPDTIELDECRKSTHSPTPLFLASVRPSRSSKQGKAGRDDLTSTNAKGPLQESGRSRYKTRSKRLSKLTEPPKIRSRIDDYVGTNSSTVVGEELGHIPLGNEVVSPLPNSDETANHGNIFALPSNEKVNQRLKELNAKLLVVEESGEAPAEANSITALTSKSSPNRRRLHTAPGTRSIVAVPDGLNNPTPSVTSKGPCESASPRLDRGDSVLNGKYGPLASQRVFAWFEGKDRAAYYPGSVLPQQSTESALLRVAFDDGNAAEIKRHLILSSRLEVGDLVKVDKARCRAHKFIVRGFEDQTDSVAVPGLTCVPSDIYGYQTMILERKSARESKDSKTHAIRERVPISSLYISGDLLKYYVDRAWSSTNPLASVDQVTHATLHLGKEQAPPQMPNARFLRHAAAATATKLPGVTTAFARRLDGLFANMVFGVTYMSENDTEKARISNLIRANGGQILAGGFDELFEVAKALSPSMDMFKGETHRTNDLQLLPWAAGFKFSALITDHYSRKAKYMQALALNLPCLSGRWVTDCIHKKEIVQWDKYLLPAGESIALSGAVRSRTSLTYSDILTSTLQNMINSRPKLLHGQEVLMVMGRGKTEPRRQAHLFLTQALAPKRVLQVPDLESAQQVLQDKRTVFHWIYVYDGDVSKVKNALDRQNVVGDEFVMQSLILGALVERDHTSSSAL